MKAIVLSFLSILKRNSGTFTKNLTMLFMSIYYVAIKVAS